MAKKILHILKSNSYSGAENVVATIIDSFESHKLNSEFVYVSPDGPIRDVLNEKNIKFEPLKSLAISEIKRVIKKYNPDIIHAHDFSSSVICSVSCGKIPVVSHLHNNCPWLKKPCLKSIVYFISCFKYKHIIGVSDSVFEEYIFGKVIAKKTLVAGNPIDTKKVVELAGKSVSKECYDICFLGRLTEQKDPLRFVEFIKVLSNTVNVTAVMIGDGELRHDLENKIRSLKLEDKITIKGFLSNPYSLLKNTRVLCIPSKWEGFGLVAVEALSLGIPVVASNVGGLPGIITEKCGKICNTDNDFLDFMKDILTKKELWEKYSKGAIQRATELDNVEDYCVKLDEVYKQLLTI